MKRIKVAALALGLMIVGALSANAQKIGYIDGQAIVYQLPEIEKVGAELQKYQQDSIGGQYEVILAEYKRKDSIIKDVKTPKAVKTTAEKDFADLQYTLSNWQQIATDAAQAKENQLLQPLYKKVRDAINAVAKEKAYAYVLNREAILIGPDGDDLSKPVMDKLGIKPRPATPAAK